MSEQSTSWYDVGSVSRVEIMVSAALLNAARGLSELLKRPITTGTVQARVVDFDISKGIGHPESEMVGVYLQMGDMESSALAEAGHLMVAYFLNAMAVLTGKPLRPSPPGVMVNMLGAIVSVLATCVGEESDELMIIETVLQDAEGLVKAHFWVLPDLASQFQ